VFSSKAKVMVSSESKSWLMIQEEVDLLCGAVYQRQFQPIIKAKWKVKEGEGVRLSKASKKDISLVGSRKVVASGEVAEERVIGGLATAPKPTKIVVGAIRSCTNRPKGFLVLEGKILFLISLIFWSFVLFLYIRGSLVYFLCTRVVSLYTLNEFELLVKTKVAIC
jgi:hypothetical protein